MYNAAEIVQRYSGGDTVRTGSYATVADFCDSADHLRGVTGLDGDLKNVQRPWAVKTLLRCIPPPARLLEIGGGQPIVSDFLQQLGYETTLVDPYDGFGNGPTEYEKYRRAFPNVRIIPAYFEAGMLQLRGEQFDGIFSISVLEHLTSELARTCFAAIAEFLRPGGYSIHCFDFILQGIGHEHDCANAERLLNLNAALVPEPPPGLSDVLQELRGDVETFFLSPQGHHHWRGGKAYAEFPFRKVVSLQTIAQRGTAVAS